MHKRKPDITISEVKESVKDVCLTFFLLHILQLNWSERWPLTPNKTVFT